MLTPDALARLPRPRSLLNKQGGTTTTISHVVCCEQREAKYQRIIIIIFIYVHNSKRLYRELVSECCGSDEIGWIGWIDPIGVCACADASARLLYSLLETKGSTYRPVVCGGGGLCLPPEAI